MAFTTSEQSSPKDFLPRSASASRCAFESESDEDEGSIDRVELTENYEIVS